jgi:hypothetical protein
MAGRRKRIRQKVKKKGEIENVGVKKLLGRPSPF